MASPGFNGGSRRASDLSRPTRSLLKMSVARFGRSLRLVPIGSGISGNFGEGLGESQRLAFLSSRISGNFGGGLGES